MIQSIKWHNNALQLLDQRILPHKETYHTYTTASATAEAIAQMVVRGAPAIGVTAAYGMALAAQSGECLSSAQQQLANSRPTAVNLFWALERCAKLINTEQKKDSTKETVFDALLSLAKNIHEDDINRNQAIANHGADFIKQAYAVYTHCNTGALATGGVGTALGVIRELHHRGKLHHIYAGETRPWLQGSRLTAWELQHDNIPFQLVPDSSSAYIMSKENIGAIIVGADRIAANGDVANKIGTYSLAVLAKHHGIPFMVAAPKSSFDLSLKSGEEIIVEVRDDSEITHIQGTSIAPANCPSVNYAFDITPNHLISAIITEFGVIEAPFIQGIKNL